MRFTGKKTSSRMYCGMCLPDFCVTISDSCGSSGTSQRSCRGLLAPFTHYIRILYTFPVLFFIARFLATPVVRYARKVKLAFIAQYGRKNPVCPAIRTPYCMPHCFHPPYGSRPSHTSCLLSVIHGSTPFLEFLLFSNRNKPCLQLKIQIPVIVDQSMAERFKFIK